MFRPFSGNSMIRLFSMTPPTVAFSVESSTAAADTSTVSVTCPTCRTKFCRTCAAVSTRTPRTVSVLNPVISQRMS